MIAATHTARKTTIILPMVYLINGPLVIRTASRLRNAC
jgi:hypothetical protein